MSKVDSFLTISRALLEICFIEEPEEPISEQGYLFTLTKVAEHGQPTAPSAVWRRFLGISEIAKHDGLYHDDTIADLYNQVGILLGARAMGDFHSISIYSYDIEDSMKARPLTELMDDIFKKAVSITLNRYAEKMQSITVIFNTLVEADGSELFPELHEKLWEKAVRIYKRDR